MEKIPGSNTPIMSPAYASLTISLSCAIICCGWESFIFLLPCIWNTSISLSNFPEQILIKAILSLWFLFIFAWILKTNAEKSSLVGSINPSLDSLGKGGVVRFKNSSRNGSTPKFVSAEPKNTGVSSPLRTASRSNSSPAPSSSSTSSRRMSFWPYAKWLSSCGSSKENSSFKTSFWPLFAVKARTFFDFLSYTPLNSLPEPIGQLIGQVFMPKTFSMSSSKSYGLLESLSILFIKVIIGMCRITQTLNSFMVWFSTPLLPSITITAQSAAISVRYVSSEKSWCPGVSRILMQ